MVTKILIVCTGNTCRSPMAVALLSAEIQKHPDLQALGIEVRSAGTGGGYGEAASAGAIAAMDRNGINLRAHRSSQVSAELIAWADLILTMGINHKDAILRMVPDAKRRTHLISEYAGSTGSISDPYGHDQAVYDACADELQMLTPAIVGRLNPRLLPAVVCPDCGKHG